jgi:hypothetical protein
MPGLGNRGKQDGNQNGDNADHDQKFDKCETSSCSLLISVRPPHPNLDQAVDIFALFMSLWVKLSLSPQIYASEFPAGLYENQVLILAKQRSRAQKRPRLVGIAVKEGSPSKGGEDFIRSSLVGREAIEDTGCQIHVREVKQRVEKSWSENRCRLELKSISNRLNKFQGIAVIGEHQNGGKSYCTDMPLMAHRSS